MRYSLIIVTKRIDNKVSGHWMVNHTGTLSSAKQLAVDTNKINSNALDIAIVEEVSSVVTMLEYFENLEDLGYEG